MNLLPLSLSAPEQNLRRLLMVRGLFLLFLCATLTFSYWALQLTLPYQPLLWIISAMTLINLATHLQLRLYPNTSQSIFFSQLLIDILGITLLLFFSGGADNPFVSYYLVPLCIAAATLPKRFAWPLALMALASYTSLFFWNIALPDVAPAIAIDHGAMGHGALGVGVVDLETEHLEAAVASLNTGQHSGHNMSGISAHTAGMWFNFLISATLITYFVVEMAASLRQQDRELARYREDDLRDEQLLAIATLAAGTAHELGSPLTTIKTLLGEMRADYQDTNLPALDADLDLLQSQVLHCADTLRNLNERAAQLKDGALPAVGVHEYLEKVIDDWQLLRPEVEALISFGLPPVAEPTPATLPEVKSNFHPTIALAITNLLNNAADANPKDIHIHLHWSEHELLFAIKDRGPGISDEIKKQMGQAFNSHKGRGRGLGLFLTHATLNRYGGEITLNNRQSGGTITQLQLPLPAASVQKNNRVNPL